MATTKKGTAGKKAGAGARKTQAKAKGVAKPAAVKAKAKAETKTKTNSANKSQAKVTSKAASAPAAKKAAPVKLNDRQRDLLGRVKGAGDSGYVLAGKAEQRSIDALVERKLLKKGTKNKATGAHPYLLTRAGEKHLPASMPAAAAPAPTAPPMPAPVSEPAASAETAPAPPA